MLVRVALIGFLVAFAGCAGKEAPSGDGTQAPLATAEADLAGQPHEKAGDFVVHNVGAQVCAPGPFSPELGTEVNWASVRVDHAANDTRVRVLLEWQAVNPTAEDLQFRLMAEQSMGDDAIQAWTGPSPQVLLIEGRELAALPDPFWVQVSATGCPSETPAGAHVVPKGTAEQAVHYVLEWNGADLD